MSIEIKRVELKDAETLALLSCKTFYDTFTGTCTEEDMQSFLKEFFNTPKVEQELQNPNDFYYFAYVDGNLAGYMRFQEDYTGFEKMKEWKSLELKRIYIDVQYKGGGVAQALMNFLLDYAQEHQYKAIFLGVWEHNFRAHKFYEKYGFTNSGFTHDFPIGNTPQTDWWFWKFL